MIVNMATGFEMDKDKLWRTFQRIRNMVRAVNVKRGLRREHEKPPEDHWAVRDHDFEQKLLDDYYDFKGWTVEGIPTKETLSSLDLDFVVDDFLKTGILSGNEVNALVQRQAEKEEKSGGR
jgi:aldehyde:ferredoxin oxidoreductase